MAQTRKSTQKFEVVYIVAGSITVVRSGVSKTDAKDLARSLGSKAIVRPVAA
jgi:hypothetical protein